MGDALPFVHRVFLGRVAAAYGRDAERRMPKAAALTPGFATIPYVPLMGSRAASQDRNVDSKATMAGKTSSATPNSKHCSKPAPANNSWISSSAIGA